MLHYLECGGCYVLRTLDIMFKTIKKLISLCALAVFIFSYSSTSVGDSSSKYSVSVGAIVFSDFTDNSDTEYLGASYSMPFSFSIKQSDLSWRISTSHLTQVEEDVAYNGWGDTSISLAYRLNDNFDIKYRHKFATGDEDLGFSSGEDDDAVGVDFFHILGNKWSLFASAGYKWVGEGDRTDRQNAANTSIGLGYIVSNDFSLMSSLDYYQSSYTTSEDVSGITLLGSHKINSSVRIGWFVSGDSSNTYSAGTNLGYSF